ncbi:MAG: hypothetical protein KC589_00020, partial [Nanoarchaeota archaeon]|nr:hypothetical protein [Nanoarchaeota archaeon]
YYQVEELYQIDNNVSFEKSTDTNWNWLINSVVYFVLVVFLLMLIFVAFKFVKKRNGRKKQGNSFSLNEVKEENKIEKQVRLERPVRDIPKSKDYNESKKNLDKYFDDMWK